MVDLNIVIITNGRSTFPFCLKSFGKNSVNVIRNKRWVDALNEALNLSSCHKFLLRVDDDFIVHPKTVEYMTSRVWSLSTNPDKIGMYYCFLFEDWTNKPITGIKIYNVDALKDIGGFTVDEYGKTDKVTNKKLIKAGYKLIKDKSIVGIHVCAPWEEQLEYERLWSNLAKEPYRKSTHNEMLEYCNRFSDKETLLKYQFNLRENFLNGINQKFRTPFGDYLYEIGMKGI